MAFALITLEKSQGSECYVIGQQYMLLDCSGDEIVQCVCGTHVEAEVSCDSSD